MFDIDEKGFIRINELEEAFALFEIYPSRDEMELIMRKYDKDSDGKLNFNEFCEMIVPKDRNYSSLLKSRKAYNAHFDFKRSEPFTPDTMVEFKQFLLRLINNEGRAETLRQ